MMVAHVWYFTSQTHLWGTPGAPIFFLLSHCLSQGTDQGLPWDKSLFLQALATTLMPDLRDAVKESLPALRVSLDCEKKIRSLFPWNGLAWNITHPEITLPWAIIN